MRDGEFGRLTPRRARLLMEAVKRREQRASLRFGVLATKLVGGSPADHFPELLDLTPEPSPEELGLKIAAAFGFDAADLEA